MITHFVSIVDKELVALLKTLTTRQSERVVGNWMEVLYSDKIGITTLESLVGRAKGKYWYATMDMLPLGLATTLDKWKKEEFPDLPIGECCCVSLLTWLIAHLYTCRS